MADTREWDWEAAQGDVLDRVHSIGARSNAFLDLKGIPRPERGPLRADNHVGYALGIDALQLVLDEEREAAEELDAAGQQEQRVAWAAAVDEQAAVQPGGAEHEDESSLALTAETLLDEEWPTANWDRNAVDSAVQTLLKETTKSASARRREIATRMLLRLCTRHAVAVRTMENAAESLVNNALEGPLRGIKGTLAITALLDHLAGVIGTKLSQLSIVPLLARRMSMELDAAGRLVQHKFRKKFQRIEADGFTTREMVLRHNCMMLIKTSELRKRWRRVLRSRVRGEYIPKPLARMYLRLLHTMTSDGISEYVRFDRARACRAAGLIPLLEYVKSSSDLSQYACGVLLNLAQEKSLLQELLCGGAVHALVAVARRSAPEALPAVDVLDALALCALRVRDINAGRRGRRRRSSATDVMASLGDEQGQGQGQDQDDDQDQDQDEDEDQEDDDDDIDSADDDDKTRVSMSRDEAILAELGGHHLTSCLAALLRSGSPDVVLGAGLVLHKLACTTTYHAVLRALVAHQGRALVMAVGMLRSEAPFVPLVGLAVLKQLASREEGRDGMVVAGCIGFCRQLFDDAVREGDFERPHAVLALTAAVALARQGQYPSLRPAALHLDAPPEQLVDNLYDDLLTIMSRPGGEPARTVAFLHEHGLVAPLVAFLSRPQSKSWAFDMSRPHRYTSAIVLSRLMRNGAVCRQSFGWGLLRFLGYVVQANESDRIDGEMAHDGEDDYAFHYLACQCACLAFQALIKDRSQPHKRDLGESVLRETNALEDVCSLLALPVDKELPSFRLNLHTVEAAVLLVGALAPLPGAEGEAFAVDGGGDNNKVASVRDALPFLLKLCRMAAPTMLRVLMEVHSATLQRAICATLSSLGSTDQSARLLLKLNASQVLFTVVPQQPLVLQNPPAGRALTDKARAIIDAAEDADEDQLKRVPSAVFWLLASLARVHEGRVLLHELNIFTRAVHRFIIAPDALDGSTHVGIAMLIARMANTHTGAKGSANDIILAEGVLATLLRMLDPALAPRCHYYAAMALKNLSDDIIRVVPRIVAVPDGVASIMGLVNTLRVTKPTLRLLLCTLVNIATIPMRSFGHLVLRAGIGKLQDIARDYNVLAASKRGSGEKKALSELAREILDAIGMLEDTSNVFGERDFPSSPSAGPSRKPSREPSPEPSPGPSLRLPEPEPVAELEPEPEPEPQPQPQSPSGRLKPIVPLSPAMLKLTMPRSPPTVDASLERADRRARREARRRRRREQELQQTAQSSEAPPFSPVTSVSSPPTSAQSSAVLSSSGLGPVAADSAEEEQQQQQQPQGEQEQEQTENEQKREYVSFQRPNVAQASYLLDPTFRQLQAGAMFPERPAHRPYHARKAGFRHEVTVGTHFVSVRNKVPPHAQYPLTLAGMHEEAARSTLEAMRKHAEAASPTRSAAKRAQRRKERGGGSPRRRRRKGTPGSGSGSAGKGSD